jgi:hypothetical protein
MTKQQAKFKAANSACRKEVKIDGGWPARGDWKRLGSCMRRRLKRKGR